MNCIQDYTHSMNSSQTFFRLYCFATNQGSFETMPHRRLGVCFLFLLGGVTVFLGPSTRTQRAQRAQRGLGKVTLRAEENDFAELLSLLERAGLSSYSSQILEWCEEQGASTSEEVIENLEDLADDLDFSAEDLQHLKLTHDMQQELHEVCASGNHQRLAEILPNCDLTARDQRGRQAIHLAAGAGHIEVTGLCHKLFFLGLKGLTVWTFWG